MNLAEILIRTETAIAAQIDLPNFTPCKVSMWLKFVRYQHEDGSQVEQVVGRTQKLIFTAGSFAELVNEVTENLVLAVYGAEVPLVQELPNLIIRLFERKAIIPSPGAPPLNQEGQLFLKATVYRYEEGLWERLFGSPEDASSE